MTLIMAYSYDTDSTVFVNDFRTTTLPGLQQADNAFKFISICNPMGNHLGLFLAGNVNGWNKIFESIAPLLKKSKNGNFIEGFRDILLDYALSQTSIVAVGTRLSALGFIFEEDYSSNKPFHIDYIQGKGATIEELEKNKVYSIGSGAGIGGLSKHLNNAMFNYISDSNRPSRQKEPYLVANIFEGFLSTYIENLNDPSIYGEKGISNVFGYSFVQQNYFQICSYTEKKFASNHKMYKQFSFEKDKNGDSVLKDVTNNINSKLLSLEQIVSGPPLIIDPFDREWGKPSTIENLI